MTEAVRAYARGLLGALLVSLPLLATMEMWWQGFTMPPAKMLLFLLVNFGVLLVLETYSGMKEESTLLDEVGDALAAYGIGFVAGALVLLLFGTLHDGMGTQEIVGKILLQSIPLSVGASLAMSQLGQSGRAQEERKERAGPAGSLALSLAGAWYFGFNVAPTEEPMLIGLRIHAWHAVGLLLASLLMTHAIVYALGFAGGRELPAGGGWWGTILTHGVGSTVVAMLAALYLLWTFGRVGLDTGLGPTVHMVVVMGFVNSLGAAAAKLIL